jgi:hypothetical protein
MRPVFLRLGISASQLNEEIYRIAEREQGITRYWHNRIFRAGANTLLPLNENPPDLPMAEGDIPFLDPGPVFEEREADFGRTFVIDSHPAKVKLRDDIGKALVETKKYFERHTGLTGRELGHHTLMQAEKYGWEYGCPIAGHFVGIVPHE